MVQKKEFSKEEALRKALDVFWQKGYYNTSIQDLVDALCLGRGSIYNFFGSKKRLFISSLELYIKQRNKDLKIKFETNPAKEVFKELLESIIYTKGINKGCFVVNEMNEMAVSDKEVSAILNKSEDDLINMFNSAILPLSKNSKENSLDISLFLSNTMKGLRVLSKMNRDKEELSKIIDVSLGVLDKI